MKKIRQFYIKSVCHGIMPGDYVRHSSWLESMRNDIWYEVRRVTPTTIFLKHEGFTHDYSVNHALKGRWLVK